MRDDEIFLDELTKDFFNLFTNRNNQQPDWQMIYILCIPETIIIKKCGSEEVVYTLETFIAPRKKILTDGTLTAFEEIETHAETRIIGNIAQRFSEYKKSGYLHGKFFEEKGNKFFQFIKTIQGWKINALIWEDDSV